MKFLSDFFPILLFFIAYKTYDIYVATAVAIAASLLQVGYFQLRYRKVENMQWITLGLLVFFGGLTLLLRDPDYIIWKPTVVNGLFAIAFLGSQFIGSKNLLQRMMDQAISLPAAAWKRLNYIWISFFVFVGLLNLYVAYDLAFLFCEQAIDKDACAEDIWVDFKLFGMLGLTFVFIIGQGFYIARHITPQQPHPENDS